MKYEVYQVKQGTEYRDYRWCSMEELESLGLEIKRENYNLVKEGNIEFQGNDLLTLKHLWTLSNAGELSMGEGHSLSVSDVVILNERVAYYCDNFGWKGIDFK